MTRAPARAAGDRSHPPRDARRRPPSAFDIAFSTTTGALNQVLRELSATGRMRFTIPPGIGGVTFGQVLATADPTALASLALRPLVLGMMEDLLSDYPAPSFFDARGEALAPFQVEHVDVHQQDNRITLYGNFPS